MADIYCTLQTGFFEYGTNSEEMMSASPLVRQAYETWRKPPRVELYDLQTDPWEFQNLSAERAFSEPLQRLQTELQRFREQYRDPLLDPEKLQQLAEEHRVVAEELPRGRYSAGQQWRYQQYLQNRAEP